MAYSPQAKKRNRQNVKRRVLNASQKSMLRTYCKRFVTAADNQDADTMKVLWPTVQKLLDRYGKNGLIHARKASRLKSQYQGKIKALT